MPNPNAPRRRELERRRKRCGARCKTKDGEPCRAWALENGRCRMHGGSSKRGFELSITKTGRYAKYLRSDRLREMYEAAKGDERLSELDEEAAILQTLIFDQLESVNFQALDYPRLKKLVDEIREAIAEEGSTMAGGSNGSDEVPDDVLPQGRLGDFAVLRPRLCSRGGVFFLSCRYWYEPSKLAGVNFLKAAKDQLDENAIRDISADLVAVANQSLETFSGIVAAPSPRHSAFAGIPHFASALARQVAEATGNEYAELFEPIPADRLGHHPRREKEPPKLKDAASVAGKRVLLIDDVATSGQTIELHAKALRSAGAKVSAIVWVYGTTKGLGR
ncbi:prtase [Caudoviricetes sp.]|nr:prtase [Caudoviricetes sp.]